MLVGRLGGGHCHFDIRKTGGDEELGAQIRRQAAKGVQRLGTFVVLGNLEVLKLDQPGIEAFVEVAIGHHFKHGLEGVFLEIIALAE